MFVKLTAGLSLAAEIENSRFNILQRNTDAGIGNLETYPVRADLLNSDLN